MIYSLSIQWRKAGIVQSQTNTIKISIAIIISLLSSVIYLLLRRCPPAIILGVALVVINAVKGFPYGSLAHIAQKGLKAFTPIRAYLYATFKIIFCIIAIFPRTSIFHRSPRCIAARAAHSMRSIFLPCRGTTLAGSIDIVASTGFSSPVAQTKTKNRNPFSAITNAYPPHILSLRRQARQNSDATELLSCKINRCWHKIYPSQTLYNDVGINTRESRYA